MDKASGIDEGRKFGEHKWGKWGVTHHTDRGTKCVGRDVMTEFCSDHTRITMGACYAPEERRRKVLMIDLERTEG